MKEKYPVKGIGFGVPSAETLYKRAELMIKQDAEFVEEPDILWLYKEYADNYYPEAYSSWLFALQTLLSDSDQNELITGKIKHWYMGPRPSQSNKGLWLNGPFKVETELVTNNQDPLNGFYIDEFMHLKTEIEKGLATDEELPDLCTRLAWLYIETNPSIKITLYDAIQQSASSLDNEVLIENNIYKKREPSTSYHKPKHYAYDERIYRNHNGINTEQSYEEVASIFSNVWANSQVIREYGNVMGCGSRLIGRVVELC